MDEIRKITFISYLAAVAIAIYVVESFVPSPFPWLKFGFSHIITLFCILFAGVAPAFFVVVLRTVVGSLIAGKLFSPAFVLGLGGGLVATAVMATLVVGLKGRGLGVVGISVSGAWVNNLVQVLLAYGVFIRHREIFSILPVFLLFGIASGFLNGIVVYYLSRYGERALKLKTRYFSR